MRDITDQLFLSLPHAVPDGDMRESLLGHGGWERPIVSHSKSVLGPRLKRGEDVAHWLLTQDTRQALVEHEHLYLIYILTICT